MLGLTQLHMIAQMRNDGFSPQFLELMVAAATPIGGSLNVHDLASYREAPTIQAGPNPCPPMPQRLPTNITRLPDNRALAKNITRAQQRARGS